MLDQFSPSVALPQVGSRIEVVQWAYSPVIDDNKTVPPGTKGTVTCSESHQLGVEWDNGSRLFMVPGDAWRPCG